jgi:hypothetical protein
MSNVDIIARLKLNAQNFSAELTKELGGVERKFGDTGNVIGRNLAGGIGGGLQEASARIPVLGSALSGLSGSALIAAAGLGAVTAVLAKGIEEADGYEEAIRGLDAVLRATGNTTGYTRDQLVAFADDLEGAIATPSEEIQGAEKVLASFGGVAGDVFKRAIKDAADLAAVYGGDLTSNTEKLGTVLQNLAQGEITGLSKGFKFLGVETLTTIENLAKVGKTAEAQEALLKALEQRVGGTAENKAGGLTGAFFRLKDAIGDASRELAEKSGAYDASKDAVDRLAASVGTLADRYAAAKGARDLWAATLDYVTPGQIAAPKTPKQQGPEKIDADPYGLNRSLSLDAIVSRNAADQAYSSAEKLRQAEKAKTDAEAAAKKAHEAAIEAAKKEAQEQTATLEKLRDKYGEITGAARDYEKAISDIIRLEQAGKLSLGEGTMMSLEVSKKQGAAQQEEMKKAILGTTDGVDPVASLHAQAQAIGELKDKQMEAAQAVAERLRREGIAAVREVGAEMTTVFGSKLGSAFQAIADKLGKTKEERNLDEQKLSQGISKIAKGVGLNDEAAAKIGDKVGKAFGGADTGALINNLDKQLGISKALGLKSSKTGAEIGGAIGKLSGLPGGDIIGSIIGSVVGGLFKKTKYGTSTLGFLPDGSLGVASTGGNNAGAVKASSGAGGAVTASLDSIAEQLGGKLNGAISTSIGQYNGNWRVSTTGYTGKLNFKGDTGPNGKGLLDFGDDEQAAIMAAISDALSDGVITGISDASKRILASGKDLNKALQQAIDIESIPKQIKAIQDPFGSALDALNDKFTKLKDTLNEAGATSAQLADAEKLYGLEREQIVKQLGDAATATLKSFRDGLKGSDAYSLRDQEAQAKAALDPYLSSIGTGASVDQQKYTEAAQKYLDVERALYGSTDKYFAALDMIQSATNSAIATIDSVTPIRDDTTPFVKATADATATTAANTEATADILAQQTQLLSGQLDQMIQLMSASGGGFIGSVRSF